MTRLLLWLILGVETLILGGLILQILHLPILLLLIPILAACLYVIPNLVRDLKGNTLKVLKHLSADEAEVQHDRKYTFTVLVIIIFCSLLQSLVLLRGGTVSNGKFLTPALHDTMWNLSLVNESLSNIPPEHPSLAGITLKNNHFFYPFFLGILHSLTGITTTTLYFVIGPLLVGFLFGLSIFNLTTLFTSKKFLQISGLLFGYFGGNAAYLLPYLLNNPKFDWKGNSFFADQPFDQMVNPYSILGLTLVLTSAVCIYLITAKKDTSWLPKIVLGFTLGLAFGIKSFAAILLIPALIITFIFSKNKQSLLLSCSLAFLLSCFAFFLVAKPGQSTLLYIPGWILTEMTISGDKLGLHDLASKEFLYRDMHATNRLLLVKLQELLIYLAGNLWVRVISLIFIIINMTKLFTKSRHAEFLSADEAGISTSSENKKILKQGSPDPIGVQDDTQDIFHKNNETLIFLSSIIIFSLSLPLLFNLRYSSYNIIQFTPYSLVILDTLIPLAIYQLITKSKHGFWAGQNDKRKVFTYATIILFFLLSIPVTIKNILGKVPTPREGIPMEEAELLLSLDSKLPKNAVIVIDPQRFKGRPQIEERDPSYVSALSRRPLYLGSDNFVTQTGNNGMRRETLLTGFFANNFDGTILEMDRPLYFYIRSDVQQDHLSQAEYLKLPIVMKNSQAAVVSISK